MISRVDAVSQGTVRNPPGRSRPATERTLVVLGLTALVLGSLVYPAFRDGPSLLVPVAGPWLGRQSGLFLLDAFPTFAHVFGFAALLLATLWPSRRAAICGVVTWLAISLLLELLQLPVISMVLRASDSRLAQSVVQGTFDILDLLAIGMAGVSVGLLAAVMHRRQVHDARHRLRRSLSTFLILTVGLTSALATTFPSQTDSCTWHGNTFVPASQQLEVGETLTVTASFIGDPVCGELDTGRVDWYTTDSRVVVIESRIGGSFISAQGAWVTTAVVRAAGLGGPATIVAELTPEGLGDALTASGTVMVVPGAATIEISSPPPIVLIGTPVRLTAIVRNANGVPFGIRSLQWTGSNPTVASVDPQSGLVTGLNPGMVTVTVTDVRSGLTADVTIEVRLAVASVTVSPSMMRLGVGSQVQLVATLRAGDNSVIPLTNRDVVWSTDNAAAIGIAENADQSVTATARNIGLALVSATVEGVSNHAQVNVDPAVDRLVLTPTSAQLQVGGTAQFTATPFTAAGNALGAHTIAWQSNALAVASVTPTSGLSPSTVTVTGHSAGTAIISASTGGKSATASVTVGTPAVSVSRVSISPSTPSVFVGVNAQLIARTYGGTPEVELTNRAITWQITDGSIAQVNPLIGASPSTVTVVGLAAGSSTIRATSEGVSITVPITVTTPPPPPPPTPRYAFAVSNQLNQSYNSRGGPITITTQGTGMYRVHFPGQQSATGEVETLLVTAYGQAAVYCAIASWANAGPDLEANVRCYRQGAILTDMTFSIMLLGDNALGGRFGFAFANQASAPSYTATSAFNSAGASVSVQKVPMSTGTYDVAFTGMVGTGADAVIVTPTGSGGQSCAVGNQLTGTTVRVNCFNGVSMAAADATFTVARMSAGRSGKRAAGAYIQDPSGLADDDIVVLPTSDRFTTGSGVRLRKVTTGEYEVVFLGLSPAGAAPLGIQVVDVAESIGGNQRYQGFCSIASAPTVQGSDLTVRVRCFHENGDPDDEAFYVVIIE